MDVRNGILTFRIVERSAVLACNQRQCRTSSIAPLVAIPKTVMDGNGLASG